MVPSFATFFLNVPPLMVPLSLFVTSPSNTPFSMVPLLSTALVNVVVPVAPSLPVMSPVVATSPLMVPPSAYRSPSRSMLALISASPLMVSVFLPTICSLPLFGAETSALPLMVVLPLK